MTTHPRKPVHHGQQRPLPRLAEEADPAAFFTRHGTKLTSFAEAMEDHFPNHQPDHTAASPHPQPLGERLKNYPPPQAECDCHGLTAAEAEAALGRFLAQAERTALCTVRIITGKGLHSPSGPVLRDMVELELRLLKKMGAILAFRWEKKEKERSGSVVVYL